MERFTLVGSVLNCKHYTKLERLARDKHSSLLQKSVSYGRKIFIVQAPGLLNESSYLVAALGVTEFITITLGI